MPLVCINSAIRLQITFNIIYIKTVSTIIFHRKQTKQTLDQWIDEWINAASFIDSSCQRQRTATDSHSFVVVDSWIPGHQPLQVFHLTGQAPPSTTISSIAILPSFSSPSHYGRKKGIKQCLCPSVMCLFHSLGGCTVSLRPTAIDRGGISLHRAIPRF